MDVDKAIAVAVKTGKVLFGANSAIRGAKTGRVKLVILASNCPKNVKEDVEYYCRLSDIPIMTYKGTSADLAALCGKPFLVSALSIREAGDSDILNIVKGEEV